jgi:hypothetical protein
MEFSTAASYFRLTISANAMIPWLPSDDVHVQHMVVWALPSPLSGLPSPMRAFWTVLVQSLRSTLTSAPQVCTFLVSTLRLNLSIIIGAFGSVVT